jgi:hypothetical protein
MVLLRMTGFECGIELGMNNRVRGLLVVIEQTLFMVVMIVRMRAANVVCCIVVERRVCVSAKLGKVDVMFDTILLDTRSVLSMVCHMVTSLKGMLNRRMMGRVRCFPVMLEQALLVGVMVVRMSAAVVVGGLVVQRSVHVGSMCGQVDMMNVSLPVDTGRVLGMVCHMVTGVKRMLEGSMVGRMYRLPVMLEQAFLVVVVIVRVLLARVVGCAVVDRGRLRRELRLSHSRRNP